MSTFSLTLFLTENQTLLFFSINIPNRFRNGFSTGVVCGLDYLHNGKPPWWDVDRVRSFSRYLLEDRVTPSRFGDGKKNGKPPRWDVDQMNFARVVEMSSGYYLVDLEVNNAWLSIDNMNPMPMLRGLEDPRIHLHNLKTCHWTVPNHVFSLTLITPKLSTLRLEYKKSTGLHVESPMLSHLHIDIDSASSFEVTEFEKLKTVQLKSINIRSLLDKFPLIDKVENLTVESRNLPSGTDGNSSFTLYHVFRDFPA
ncbi:hypothetical protein Tco_0606042 [Tanacetum coccineum]